MTTTTTPTQVDAVQSARLSRPEPQMAVTFPRVVRSEWIKLRSLRSTVWSFAIMILASWGLALLMPSTSSFDGASIPPEEQARIVLQAATFGVFFGQLVAAVLGVLVISGEYSTGMIRSTLTAVPTRIPALAAKTLVLGVTTFAVALISNIGAFLIASPLLAAQGLHAQLFSGDVLVPLLTAALYLAVVAVFSLGLGTMLRSSAGGIAAALGAILLLPIALMMLPLEWAYDMAPYLLMNAGMESFGLNGIGAASGLEPWQLILVTLAWAAVTLIAGAALLKRRDA